jgi:hypothetical protein
MFVSDIKKITSGTVTKKFIIENVWNNLVTLWDKADDYKTNYPKIRKAMKDLRKQWNEGNEKRQQLSPNPICNLFYNDIHAILKGVFKRFVWKVRSDLWKGMSEDRKKSYEEDRLTHFLTDDEENSGDEN